MTNKRIGMVAATAGLTGILGMALAFTTPVYASHEGESHSLVPAGADAGAEQQASDAQFRKQLKEREQKAKQRKPIIIDTSGQSDETTTQATSAETSTSQTTTQENSESAAAAEKDVP